MGKQPDIQRRRQAFRLYVRYRNVSRVSQELNIPVATLHVWKKEEQWDEKMKDVQSRLSASLQIMEKLRGNLVLEDQVVQLKVLEHLEATVYEILVTDEVRPSKWEDVIKTLEFVNKEKRLILGEPTAREINTIDVKGMNETDLDKALEDLRSFTNKIPEIPKPPVEPKEEPKDSPDNPTNLPVLDPVVQ